ncbi:MAG: class I SAM-dependent RNA methyltransferase [Clostridiales bacterium]|jgi:putative N6-adenine-specific DNA methylase|nr:class I SAM-dependent RNA methyltransferase [Clostridiales bacterium]
MLNLIATSTFGLEATVKREITALGCKITSVSDGRIDFTGDTASIVNANISLGASDRVLLVIGEFDAATFDELFEKTKALNWQDWITKDGKFTVTGKSVKSKLFSVPDCQAIVKKAVVEKLKQFHSVEWFDETGPEYKIQVALLKDKATLTIDTTGPSLHKRGYRKLTHKAPIKETLAYAMIELSYWKKDRILLDPFCGSGTIAIEAALKARNTAPGLFRSFVCENWPQIPKLEWIKIRKEKYEQINTAVIPEIYASDIDGEAIEIAKHCAEQANVGDFIKFEQKDVKNVKLPGEYGVVITNPPYGERLLDENEVNGLYKTLGALLKGEDTWSCYVITSCEEFEIIYGKRADAKRKLFNGNVKADYYQYYGKRPPR